MRKKVVAGNWKMNNDLDQSKELIIRIKELLHGQSLNCDVIVCPPFTFLSECSTLIKDSSIKLGAQNMHFEDKGAFTGEISSVMLKSAGCEFVILGHSERRTIFNENDEIINKKIKKALEKGLNPIFCIGETLEEREKEITMEIVKRQIERGLEGIASDQMKNVIVAYEPVWAIGTGKTATPEQAQEIHEFTRSLIERKYSKTVSEKLVIQYGGSVNPDNAKELLSQKDIDGALVGGACLNADSFYAIVKEA